MRLLIHFLQLWLLFTFHSLVKTTHTVQYINTVKTQRYNSDILSTKSKLQDKGQSRKIMTSPLKYKSKTSLFSENNSKPQNNSNSDN